jgi:hypothetical protein
VKNHEKSMRRKIHGPQKRVITPTPTPTLSHKIPSKESKIQHTINLKILTNYSKELRSLN